MRLMEEKTLIKIEMILLIATGLLSWAIQFCDYKIGNYNDRLISLNWEYIKQSQASTYWNLRSFSDQLSSSLNLKVCELYVPPCYQDKAEADLTNKFRNGEINDKDYYSEHARILKGNELASNTEQSKALSEIQKLINNKPIWERIYGILSNLQLSIIIFALIGYFAIYKMISVRT